MTRLAEAAAWYAQGWPVFPVQPQGKAPATAHGFKDAERSAVAWQRLPDANIGFEPGAAGLVALDFDTYKPEFDGHDLLQRLWDEYPTLTIHGRGYSMLYAQPEGVTLGSAKGSLPRGIDVRGSGGYIILPPSVHPDGMPYQWLKGREPWAIDWQTLPGFVLDLIQRKQATKPMCHTPKPTDLTDLQQRAAAALERLQAWRVDDYDEWIRMGHALKHDLGEAGFALWDSWSSKGSKYEGSEATRKKWDSFEPSRTNIGALFKTANSDTPRAKAQTRKARRGELRREHLNWLVGVAA